MSSRGGGGKYGRTSTMSVIYFYSSKGKVRLKIFCLLATTFCFDPTQSKDWNLGLFVGGDKSQIVVQFENEIRVFTLLNFGWNSWQQPSDTLFSFLKKLLPFCLKGTRFTYQKLKPTCVLYKWRHLNSGAYHHDDSIVWPKFLTL